LVSFGAIICGLILYGSAPSGNHSTNNDNNNGENESNYQNGIENNDETRKLVEE